MRNIVQIVLVTFLGTSGSDSRLRFIPALVSARAAAVEVLEEEAFDWLFEVNLEAASFEEDGLEEEAAGISRLGTWYEDTIEAADGMGVAEEYGASG